MLRQASAWSGAEGRGGARQGRARKKEGGEEGGSDKERHGRYDRKGSKEVVFL